MSPQFDDLVQRLSWAMPKGIQVLQEDINRNLRASLEAGLGRLDLVSAAGSGNIRAWHSLQSLIRRFRNTLQDDPA